MTKRRAAFRAFRMLVPALLGTAILLAACAPGMTPEQVQALVNESVAQTVAAQNATGTSAAQTAEALAPPATSTPLPTLPSLNLPTLTPIIPTVTPFVLSGGSGGSGGSGHQAADYECYFTEVKPLINVFKPDDYIDIVWIITNSGKKDWPSALDLDLLSGTKFSPYVGEELPALKSGERVTISFEGNAPHEPGFYEMKFKVQGGLCYPFIDIEVIKPPGQDP